MPLLLKHPFSVGTAPPSRPLTPVGFAGASEAVCWYRWWAGQAFEGDGTPVGTVDTSVQSPVMGNDVFIIDAVRTPIGKIGGALAACGPTTSAPA